MLILDFCEITQHKSPKEKLNIICNLCNYICTKYKLTDKTIIIKFIIYSILKANISNLKGNLKFIALLRHRTTITSEEDYYLSLMFQALEYIEKINYTNLKIRKSEFIENCEEFDKKEILKNYDSNSKYNFNLEHDIQLVNLINKVEDDQESNFTFQNVFTQNGPILLENVNDGILNLDTEKLYNEYCSNNFTENNIVKYENMYNDFKIIMKIVESLKNEYTSSISTSINDNSYSISENKSKSINKKQNNLIDF